MKDEINNLVKNGLIFSKMKKKSSHFKKAKGKLSLTELLIFLCVLVQYYLMCDVSIFKKLLQYYDKTLKNPSHSCNAELWL